MIGPVQLIAIGFDTPDFRGEILEELERLRASDTIRVINSLVVYKDANGEVSAVKGGNIDNAESEEFGAVVGGLLGLGAGGEEGAKLGVEMGADAWSEGVEFFKAEDSDDLLEELPNDSAAALILLEHRWAIPLREAVMRAGGTAVTDRFIRPRDLIAAGMAIGEAADAAATPA